MEASLDIQGNQIFIVFKL